MSIKYNGKLIAGKYKTQVVTDATEGNKGLIRIATLEEVNAGTDNTTAVTPKGLATKQNKLTAGTGIKIEGDVISSNTQTSANWGNIQGDITAQEDLQNALDSKQDTLTAGTGISISGNTISNAFTSLDNYTTFSENALNNDQSFVYKSAAGSYSRGNFRNFVNSIIKPVFATKTELNAKQDKGDYALKSEIPTNNNQLTNGAGYITADYHDSTKQDVISDLETIRSGASKGATALQSIPAEYVTETELNAKGYLTSYTETDPIYTADKPNIASISLDNLSEEGLKVIKDNSGSGLEICDIGMALYVDETKGLRRYLNGQIVDINTNTQAFLNRLKDITTLHPSLLCTEEEWQTAKTMSAFGQVGKFVFNYSGDNIISIRLPRVVNVQGLFDLQNLGMTVEAGLPNIEGRFVGGNPNGYTDGAFKLLNNSSSYQGGPSYPEAQIGFDASLSNQIYGNSDTVQPEAIQYPYFIQIATGSETENNIINEIELNNPYSLFDSKYSDHELNNLSWLKSSGQWNSKTVYPSAYDELLREYNDSTSVEETEGSITFKRTPKGYKIALADQETAIDTKYTTDGIAWYYILDTTNEKFKLPRTKFGFEGLRTNVGDDIGAGLPNITGTAQTAPGRAGYVVNGALAIYTTQNATNVYGTGPTGTSTQFGISLDASRSNPIYGKSNTVQPPATQMYLYFYVGETVQNANLIDAGRIGEQLATKTDMLQASSAGMPSNKYINLTLGANGSTYTAPANGWFVVFKRSTKENEILELSLTATGFGFKYASTGAQGCFVSCPVKKGDIIKCGYTTTGATNFFRFIYAEGSK